MMRITPSPPLGAYPQLLLCGQAGNDPTSSNTTTITMMVPVPTVSISTATQESRAFYAVCGTSQPMIRALANSCD